MPNHYSRLVHQIAKRVHPDTDEFEDLVADVIVRLLERRQSLRTPSPRFLDWAVLDALKRQRRRVARYEPTIHERMPPQAADGWSNPPVRVRARRRRGLIIRRLRTMPHPVRRVVVLKLFAGLNAREIGERLSLSVSSVHRRLTVGCEDLRESVAKPVHFGKRRRAERYARHCRPESRRYTR